MPTGNVAEYPAEGDPTGVISSDDRLSAKIPSAALLIGFVPRDVYTAGVHGVVDGLGKRDLDVGTGNGGAAAGHGPVVSAPVQVHRQLRGMGHPAAPAAARAAGTGGSGLGLSIVERQGGTIAVASRPGHTAFVMTLPQAG